jgi:hypothetical protein
VLSLTVLVEGDPAIGLLPFAATPDFDAVSVNASYLAPPTSSGTRIGRGDDVAAMRRAVSRLIAPEAARLRLPRSRDLRPER